MTTGAWGDSARVRKELQDLADASVGLLVADPAFHLIQRSDAPHDSRVTVIRGIVPGLGSGSGAYPDGGVDLNCQVGLGLAAAACLGEGTQAPPVEYAYESIVRLKSPLGVLLLVDDDTACQFAFDIACELSRAEHIDARTVILSGGPAFGETSANATASTQVVDSDPGSCSPAPAAAVVAAVGAAADRGGSLDELVRLASSFA